MSTFRRPVIRRVLSGQAQGVAPALTRLLLRVLSFIYSVAVRIRTGLYQMRILRGRHPGVPVVSVGNITVGGTGKTPFVECLARRLQRLGKVGILSRGYRGDGTDAGINDETLLLARHLGEDVIQHSGPDRVALAACAVTDDACRVLILDDGFQHRRLARDLDIVLIDALEPFGYGYLLPRGLLREPVGALRRADLIALTRTDLVTPGQLEKVTACLKTIAPEIPVIEVDFRPVCLVCLASATTRDPDWLSGRRAFCFCGIGNPESFARTLDGTGVSQVGWRLFRDHHHYRTRDVSPLNEEAARSDADLLLTTEKDAVKLRGEWLWRLPVYFLRVEAVVTRGSEILDELLLRTLGRQS